MSDPTESVTTVARSSGLCRLSVNGALASLAAVILAPVVLAGTPAQLVIHWPMEPWSETIGELESGVSAASAVMVDFPGDGSEWSIGVLGRALSFDGVDHHVQYAAPLPRAEGTIAHWLRPSTSNGTRVALYESDYSGAESPDYNGFGASGEALEIHTGLFDGDYYAVWQDGGVDDRREVRGGTVTAGAWSHVAVTWRIPGEMKLYVDCVEVDSVLMDAAFADRAPTESFLGKPSQFGGRHWPGEIDEVKVWDQAFSAVEVQNHFCPSLRPETGTLVAESPTTLDLFGASIALDGDWLLVRSPGADEVAWYRRLATGGFQYRFARPSVFSDALDSNPETPQPLDLSGGIAAVADAGDVDVFALGAGSPGSWALVKTLSAAGAENFGFSISASGDRIAVGAPAADGGGVYVFERDVGGVDAWGATLAEIANPSTEALYGRLVGLDGDLLAIYKKSVPLIGPTDRVEIFRRGESGGVPGWVPEAALSYDENTVVSLAVKGDRVALGVVEPAGENAIIVHRRDHGGPDQWGVEHVLVASDWDVADRLGAKLAWLDYDTLAGSALGSRRDHQAVYVFELGGSILKDQEMILIQKTFDPISDSGGSMGRSLAAADGLIVAGAPFNGFSIAQPPSLPALSGRLHLFELSRLFADRFETPPP